MSSTESFPLMMTVRQKLERQAPLDLTATIGKELEGILSGVRPGMKIAIGVGSRGISNLSTIVSTVIGALQEAGAEPFLIPAMGSHGGATPEGQKTLLSEYGITETAMGVPIRASMEVELLGVTEDGFKVYFSQEACRADGVLPINRVKPHTDFSGQLGSGLLKMMVVGMGKRIGASSFHRSSNRLGFEHVLRTSSRIIRQKAPILGGLALVEDAFHQTARVEFLATDQMESREEALLQEARERMARLPFDHIDLLIVDRIGKNISGAGLDPNVVGRGVHGYSSLLKDRLEDKPAVLRLFARELTPESHGNATGLGILDFATTRLVDAVDRQVTTLNTITAMTPQGVKVPIHFEADREVLVHALDTLALPDPVRAKVIHIQDTLNLETMRLSEAYLDEIRDRDDLEVLGDPEPMTFDEAGNLPGV